MEVKPSVFTVYSGGKVNFLIQTIRKTQVLETKQLSVFWSIVLFSERTSIESNLIHLIITSTMINKGQLLKPRQIKNIIKEEFNNQIGVQ